MNKNKISEDFFLSNIMFSLGGSVYLGISIFGNKYYLLILSLFLVMVFFLWYYKLVRNGVFNKK